MLSSFYLLFMLLPSFLPAGFSDLISDKAALLRLQAVYGRTLQWNSSEPTPCSWKGVHCDYNVGGVTELRLPGSGLSGQIPPGSIGNLTELLTLSLRRNSLSGTLPSDLASCTKLRKLVLQENNFSGEIPATLFSFSNLVHLNLSGNNFYGEISTEFNKLAQLRTLYMGNNQLTGSLPELNNLSELENFDVSSNRLNGSIPKFFQRFSSNSFQGNSLCGSPLDSCPDEGSMLSDGAIVGIVVGSVIALLSVLLLSFLLCTKYRILPQADMTTGIPQESHSWSSKQSIQRENRGLGDGLSSAAPVAARPGIARGNDGLVFFKEGHGGFRFEDLLRASAEKLGKASDLGSTYKAYLGGGSEVVVVKRLKNVSISEGEFREKVEGLGILVHENLVTLKGYYYGREEKLLVYDYMPMGSLSALLHGNRVADSQILTWEVRTRIAFQSARGIRHLHSLGITHGNIKPSNILLTDQYNASITEFGIPQLVSSASNPASIDYRAPEVNESRKISQQADVYSFGVLLLELLIGKAPTNALTGEKNELPRWGKSMVEGNLVLDIFDPELLKYHHIKEQIFQFLSVAISCTTQDPNGRPSMEKVTGLLKRIHVFSKQGS